jgi:hypothetical protein
MGNDIAGDPNEHFTNELIRTHLNMMSMIRDTLRKHIKG